jgi:hypothetical protein
MCGSHLRQRTSKVGGFRMKQVIGGGEEVTCGLKMYGFMTGNKWGDGYPYHKLILCYATTRMGMYQLPQNLLDYLITFLVNSDKKDWNEIKHVSFQLHFSVYSSLTQLNDELFPTRWTKRTSNKGDIKFS